MCVWKPTRVYKLHIAPILPHLPNSRCFLVSPHCFLVWDNPVPGSLGLLKVKDILLKNKSKIVDIHNNLICHISYVTVRIPAALWRFFSDWIFFKKPPEHFIKVFEIHLIHSESHSQCSNPFNPISHEFPTVCQPVTVERQGCRSRRKNRTRPGT